MGIDAVILNENESKNGEIIDFDNILKQIINSAETTKVTFKLINYIDPYSRTAFNFFQKNDLISDLSQLKTLQKETSALNFLQQLIE